MPQEMSDDSDDILKNILPDRGKFAGSERVR
jgi:hypothetical protein